MHIFQSFRDSQSRLSIFAGDNCLRCVNQLQIVCQGPDKAEDMECNKQLRDYAQYEGISQNVVKNTGGWQSAV